MKTHTQSKQDNSSLVQAKVRNQAQGSSILQAYKDKTAQLKSLEEEEKKPVQGKFETAQLAELGKEEEEPAQRKENNTGLPDNLKSGIENLSGHSMDDVKVHYNSAKPATLQAHAYAQGTNIHIGPGQEKHLPHEAWHVVQQKQGRVKPTMQMKGTIPVNDDAGLEKEADVMGARAVQFAINKSLTSKNTSQNIPATQLKSYSKTVTRSQDILPTDIHDWGTVRTKLGGINKGKDANSKIAERANTSLVALGLNNGTAMSAHMIPNRIGGAGNSTNVRPWDENFERGTWETDVEKEFDNAVIGKAGGTISYSVDTTEMSDEYYNKLKAKSTADPTIKDDATHKANIQEIPVEVSAKVGDKSLTTTSGPIDNLIK